MKRWGEPFVVALLVVAAFVTRFYALGMDSVWLDEAITYHRSQGSVARVIADSESHHHNPAYFLLMRAWLQLGDDEVMLRAPSAFFGALTIPVGYVLGRVVAGRWVATATAVALLLNPRLVAYSQEARMYALYVFGASVAMTGLVWLVAHPKEATHPLLGLLPRWRQPVGKRATLAWLACSVGWIMALYCHATAALFVFACWVVAGARVLMQPVERVRFFASFCLASLLTLLVYAPWLFRLAGQVRAFDERFWAVFPDATRAAAELGPAFFYGNGGFRWLLVALLVLSGSYALRRKQLVLVSLWLLAVLGPGLVLLVSLWQPMFIHRQFLWAVVPFGVLIGSGLSAAPIPSLRVGVLCLALVVGGRTLTTEYYEPYTKERWRDAIAFLQSQARRGHAIVARSHSVKLLLEYHFTRKTSPFRRFKYQQDRALSDQFWTSRAPLWVISRARQGGHVEAEILASGWRRVGEKSFGRGVKAIHYRPGRRVQRLTRSATSVPSPGDPSP